MVVFVQKPRLGVGQEYELNRDPRSGVGGFLLLPPTARVADVDGPRLFPWDIHPFEPTACLRGGCLLKRFYSSQ